jgi:hypothetical protein
MKKIAFLLTICFFIISCRKEAEVKYFHGWLPNDYYEFTIKDTAVSLKIFDTGHRDIDTLTGYANKDSIAWDINTDRRDGSYYYNGIINNKGDIHLEDSLALKSISKKEFDSIIKEAFHPKLVEKQKVFVMGNYIFDIKVKDWDYHDYKGTTYVFVKDKKTKKLLQTIKSKDFVFYNDISFWYEDLNFDGRKDLGFYIGNLGNYGAPATNYYLFNQENQHFEYSDEFSMIMTYGSESNAKDKTITSFSSGSLGTHYANKYKIEGTEFTLIKKMFIESDSKTSVTIEELKNGKWFKKTKYYPTNSKIDFYKGF